MIPDHPGKTTPITALPHTHPVLEYLRYRDYDPILLHAQFRAAWCYEEAPEGEQYNRWYRKHGYGWKSTPQGRIIFYSDVAGTQACWQGRYLEIERDGQTLLWHPYNEAWTPRPPWPNKEGPVKYTTASGALRNNQLCGYDAAVLAMSARSEEHKTCVLTEGPLDAARFPERGIAILGKSLSDAQALLVALKFKRAVLAFDADSAGASACVKATETLHHYGVQTMNFFTKEEQQSDSKIDAGMLGYQVCEERLKVLLTQF
jgi:hypothetical protein